MLAYVINLDRRPDRLARITAHLEELKIPMERVSAVDGRLWDGKGWKKKGNASENYWRGHYGCWMSHQHALSRAIENDVFPCMILEDDAVLSEVPEAEPGMVYLGGFESPKGMYGMHAISYSDKQAAYKFLQYYRPNNNTCDSIANRWWKLGRSKKYSKGFIAFQLEDYSDIEGGVVRRTENGRIIRR